MWLQQAVVINVLFCIVKEIIVQCIACFLIRWRQKEVPGTAEQSLAVSKNMLLGLVK